MNIDDIVILARGVFQGQETGYGVVTSIETNGQPYVRFQWGGDSVRCDPSDLTVIGHMVRTSDADGSRI